jgi:hypothetical protein
MSHATIMLSGLAGLIKRAKAPGNAELGNVPKTGTRYPHHEDIVLGSAALDRAKQHVSLWTGCIAGGLLESEPSALVAGLCARREVGQS